MHAYPVRIKVKCLSPAYVKGEYEFGNFEDLFHWFARIRGLSEGSPGKWLHGLAKDGFLREYSSRYAVEIYSNFQDYNLAQELGFKVGLLRSRDLGQIVSRKRDRALLFAKELDKEAEKHEIRN